MTEEKISLSRAIAGFLAGAIVVLVFYLWQLWPAWGPVLVIGGGAGLAVILLLGIPSFFFLRKRGMLSIYAAAMLGAVFCLAPVLCLSAFNLIDGSTEWPGAAELEFWLLYLVLPGIGGGIVGWLVAAGLRIRAS
jgi:hypothetical protein